MCGLSGAAGTLSTVHESVCQTLLIFNTIRGADSTGLAVTDRQKNTKLVKAVGTPFGDAYSSGLFELKQYENIFHGSNKCVIGHNRSATRGTVSRRNAHPFCVSEIVGAHNGTLLHCDNKHLEKYGCTTDSEALFSSIYHEGVEDAIKQVDGSYALTWYDARDDTVNFLRNSLRPLYLWWTDDRKAVFWASEYMMIFAALAHENSTLVKLEKTADTLPENKLYKFKIPDHGKAFEEPEITIVKGKEAKTYSGTNYYNRFQGQDKGQCEIPFRGRVPLTEDKAVSTGETGTSALSVLNNRDRLDHLAKSAKEAVSSVAGARQKRLEKQNILPGKKATHLYTNKENTLKVYKTLGIPGWMLYRFKGMNDGWTIENVALPPAGLPYPTVNVESGGSHAFSYQTWKDPITKKKERLILYKGYKGHLLTKAMFDKIMESGCISCQSSPPWGALPRFLTDETFICPHCDSDEAIRKLVG